MGFWTHAADLSCAHQDEPAPASTYGLWNMVHVLPLRARRLRYKMRHENLKSKAEFTLRTTWWAVRLQRSRVGSQMEQSLVGIQDAVLYGGQS